MSSKNTWEIDFVPVLNATDVDYLLSLVHRNRLEHSDHLNPHQEDARHRENVRAQLQIWHEHLNGKR